MVFNVWFSIILELPLSGTIIANSCLISSASDKIQFFNADLSVNSDVSTIVPNISWGVIFLGGLKLFDCTAGFLALISILRSLFTSKVALFFPPSLT